MTKTIDYSNGKIKITLNEPPMTKGYEEFAACTQVKRKTTSFSRAYLLGVEVMYHAGGRMCYGMLAANIEPYEQQDTVSINIFYTPENTQKYKASLLSYDTHTYKGLPNEYLEYISKKIPELIIKKESFPRCSISFEYAANDEVGSSPMLFVQIAQTLIDIICHTPEEVFEMNKDEFTKSCVTWMYTSDSVKRLQP